MCDNKREKVKRTRVTFFGIDSWNRPVFKEHLLKNFYGATDKLFDDGATEDEVLAKVKPDDITFFGSRFGCEPMGSDPGKIEIIHS